MSLSKILSAGVLLCSVMNVAVSEACPRRPFLRRPMGLHNQCCAPLHGPACCPAPMCGPAPACCPAPAPCGGCAPVLQPMFQTQLRPVPQTTLVPQQFVTYQTVPQVQMQRQAYVTQVPVTTYQNVTQYRDVAVQVNTQVAQVQTRMVPQQSVAYVPETRAVGMQYVGMQYTGLAGAPIYGGIAPYGVMAPIPATAGLQAFTLPGEPVPEPVSVNPTPVLGQPIPYMQGASTSGDWSTIRQREAAAPTAATVWQSQLHSGAVTR